MRCCNITQSCTPCYSGCLWRWNIYTRHLLFPFLAQTWPLWWKMHFLIVFKDSEHAGIQQVLQAPPSRQMHTLLTKSRMQFSSSCCIPHAGIPSMWDAQQTVMGTEWKCKVSLSRKRRFTFLKQLNTRSPGHVSTMHTASRSSYLFLATLCSESFLLRQNNATRALHSWTKSSWGKQHLTYWPCSSPLAPLKFPVGHY